MADREIVAIRMYSRPGCEDSDMVREWLTARGIPFHETNIDEDAEADRLVRQVNNGFRSTPTLFLGDEKTSLVEPTEEELEAALGEVVRTGRA